MDKYRIKIYPEAARNIGEIFSYIVGKYSNEVYAEKVVFSLANAIYSLETLPERGALRKVGTYGNLDYRQLVVDNYLIIYRVIDETKEVRIVTVRYAMSDF